MRAEIVSIGTELLLGQITDTNAVFLAQDLAGRGIDIVFRSTVGDNFHRAVFTLSQALQRADIVITIGGLGPTEDDLTKEACSAVSGIALIPDQQAEETLREFFKRRNIDFNESNLKQSLRPEKGRHLLNANGTAPGCIFDLEEKAIVCLPGPPGELKPMWTEQAVPWLIEKDLAPQQALRSRMLRFIGIGESQLEPEIRTLTSSRNPTVAPYAKTGEVHLRVSAKADTPDKALAMIDEMESRIRELVGEYIYGIDDETLEQVVVRECINAKVKIATAESCTGGLIASRITDVPGSSATFQAGLVCYADQAKTELLGVPSEMIKQYGAVSREVAIAMADGARRRTGADIAVSDTGIAGPSGGSEEKPVGLVWIGISTQDGTEAFENHFAGGRTNVKYRASQIALLKIREALQKRTSEDSGYA